MIHPAEDGSKDQDPIAGVRVVTLHLPEDEGEGLGFTLTRTLWDPYPWVREVTAQGRARAAGLCCGDCLLQIDGKDVLGLPVGQVAGLIRGDGGARGVSLLVWSCGTSPGDDPDLLWSAGGGARGERSRRALGGVLKALSCCVCGATATAPRSRAAQCTRGHIYCAGCRARLQRCALCRETLPALDSAQSRNLVAEQVFDAIAAVYDLKESHRATTPAASSSASPNLPPVITPRTSVSQRNSPLSTRKTVQFGLTQQPHHGSDNSLNRPKHLDVPKFTFKRVLVNQETNDTGSQTDLNFDITNIRESERQIQDDACSSTTLLVSHVCDNIQNLNNEKATDSQSDAKITITGCGNNIHSCQNNKNPECKKTHSYQNINMPLHNWCQTTKYQSGCCQTNCHAIPNNCHVQSSGNCHISGIQCENTVKCGKSITKSCQSSFETPYSCIRNQCYCNSIQNICHHSSQQHLDFISMAAKCNLQHRLVTRLRPASSLADLRRTTQDDLSKSLNNIHKPDEVSRERTSSVGNLTNADSISTDEFYMMTPSSPVLAWVFPQP